MKRAIIIAASSAAGLAAVLSYAPNSGEAAAETAAPGAQTGSPSQSSVPVKKFTGPVVQEAFGPVQVAISVADGKIVDVTALKLPSADPKSVQINKKAAPILTAETLEAQSADVAVVSGASFTSDGWAKSLTGAMKKAHLRPAQATRPA